MAPQRGPQKSAAPKRRRKVAPPPTRAPVSDVRTGTGYRRPNAARIAPTRAPRSDVRTGTGYRRPKPAPAPKQRAPISDIRSSTGRGTYGRRRPERIYRRESYQRDLRAAELSKLANRIRSNRLEPVKPRKGFIESTFQAFYPRPNKDAPKGRSPAGILAQGGGVGGNIADPVSVGFPYRVGKGLARATYERPGAVLGNTAKGGVEIIAGTPAGIAGLITNPSRITQLPGAVADDFSRRYGPLARGDEREFIRRVQREGAAPEILDITAIGGSAAAAGGRALSVPARAGRLGERAQRIATVRPDLRLSGDLAVAQNVHPNLFRAAGQAGQDRLRRTALARRNRQAPEARPGLQPRDGSEVVPLSPRLAARAQRVKVSKRAARSHQANRREQGIELSRGTERDIAALTPKQRKAIFHVTQGLVPVARRQGESQQAFVGRVRQSIDAQRKQIDTYRAANPNEAAPLTSRSERVVLDDLFDNADEIFGDGRLAQFHAKNIERSRRLSKGDPGVNDADAVLHPHRVQGERLGIAYEGDGLKGTERGEYDVAFVQRVAEAAEQAGLPAPAYFRHQEFATAGFGVRTAANLRRAVAAPKRSELKLLRRGTAVTDADLLTQSLAGNIKRKHQWSAVADVVDQHSFPWSRKPNGDGRSILEIKREIQARNLNPDDFEFIDFRRFRRQAGRVDEELRSPESLRKALEQGVRTAEETFAETDDELAKMQGYVAVPKGVGDELNTVAAPSGKGTRVIGRIQGIQSAAILGLNPSWLQMQLAANTLQSGLGMRGNMKDLIAGQKWYRDLPEDAKKVVDEQLGVGLMTGAAGTPKMGSLGGRWAESATKVGQIPLIRTSKGTVRVTDTNPVTLMFRIDEKQNAVFRRAVLYNEAKREAFKRMQKEIGSAQAATKRVADLLRLKPDEEIADHIERILKNPKDVEKLGEHVDRVLGDYLRFTARERRFLRPYVMFYGFLRYSLKTLFYTLPVRHPIAAAVTAKIGQLQNEEVRRILGTRDVPPWVYSRLFLTKRNGEVRRDSQGNPLSIDFARINPVTNPATEVLEASSKKDREGNSVFNPAPILGMVSPMFQSALDQAYGKSSFEDRGFRVGGSATQRRAPNVGTALRVFGNDILSSAFPYREALKLTQRERQGDDTLLFSPRPIKYKTAGPRAKELRRQQQLPSPAQQLKQDLVPFGFPRPDTTERYLRENPPKDRPRGRSRLSPEQEALRDVMREVRGTRPKGGGLSPEQQALLELHRSTR